MIDIEKNKIDSGFKLPDNYFDNFDKKIISKIKNQQVKENNKTVREIFVYSISIAASFLLVFSITKSNFANTNNNTDIESYLLDDNFIIEETLNNDNIAYIDYNNSSETTDIEEFLINDNDIDLLINNQ